MSKLIKYIIDNKLHNEKFTGNVLWWSNRDNNGIILMENGSEIYVDISVIKNRQPLNRKQAVEFNFNTNIMDCACATNVRVL